MILGLNTATGQFGIALVSSDGEVLRSQVWQSKHQDAEQLHTLIQNELTATGASFSDLSKIAVTQGPGGYTGLRLGLLCAKTIAQVQNIPLVGIVALEAIALAHRHSDGIKVCLMPGVKGEVNAAMYTVCNGDITELLAPITWSFDHLSTILSKFEAPVTVCGPFTPAIASVVEHTKTPHLNIAPSPISPVEIAQFARHKDGLAPYQINPVYSYPVA